MQKANEKASKNVAAGQKHTAEGQVQSAPAKQSRMSTATPRVTATISFKTVEHVKIDPEMDDFINAERRPANDRRKIANTYFRNDNLGTSV